jgi:hypothetical protein
MIVEFELGLLGVERVDGRLLDGEIGKSALQLMASARVPVERKLGRAA